MHVGFWTGQTVHIWINFCPLCAVCSWTRLLCVYLVCCVHWCLVTAHFSSGFSEFADDDFSVSVCVCVHAGVFVFCVCECVCLRLSLSQRIKYFLMQSQVEVKYN